MILRICYWISVLAYKIAQPLVRLSFSMRRKMMDNEKLKRKIERKIPLCHSKKDKQEGYEKMQKLKTKVKV